MGVQKARQNPRGVRGQILDMAQQQRSRPRLSRKRLAQILGLRVAQSTLTKPPRREAM